MKIIKMTAENVKKLKAVEITPDGNMVVISGRNGEGKTSVLDSIWYALGGADAMKGVSKPIREGEDHAKVTLDLGDIVITRTWTAKGTYLKIENKNGTEYKSPQALLDKLVGRLSFDPLAFSSMGDKEQRETLLSLVKIDLNIADWEKQKADTFEARAFVNRNIRDLEGQCKLIAEVPADTPDTELPMADLMAEMQKAQKIKTANDEKRRSLTDMRGEASRIKGSIELRGKTIVSLQEQLAELEAAQKEEIGTLDQTIAKGKALAAEVDALKDPDLSGFETKAATIEETNRLVRIKAKRRELTESLASDQKISDEHTEKLAALDKAKADAIKAAAFPVLGLGFTDTGVIYYGIPFSQCSAAEQLRVSISMAAALNPKVRIIRITDGSLLDSRNMKIIADMAQEKDMQVWIERVDETGKIGIVIEDGAVKAVNV